MMCEKIICLLLLVCFILFTFVKRNDYEATSFLYYRVVPDFCLSLLVMMEVMQLLFYIRQTH